MYKLYKSAMSCCFLYCGGGKKITLAFNSTSSKFRKCIFHKGNMRSENNTDIQNILSAVN